jgi:hypothetical protein
MTVFGVCTRMRLCDGLAVIEAANIIVRSPYFYLHRLAQIAHPIATWPRQELRHSLAMSAFILFS